MLASNNGIAINISLIILLPICLYFNEIYAFCLAILCVVRPPPIDINYENYFLIKTAHFYSCQTSMPLASVNYHYKYK